MLSGLLKRFKNGRGTNESEETTSLIGSVFRLVLTVFVGLLGSAIFLAFYLPLPWLLGALLATMIASLAGAPVEVKPGVRTCLIVLLGIILGSSFSPAVLANIGNWIPTLFAAGLYLFIVTMAAQFYCRKFMGMDAMTALFSGLPGGLSEMTILAEEYKADIRTVTLTHATRVASVLLVIPFFLTYWVGLEGTAVPAPKEIWSLMDVVILVAIAGAGYWIGRLIRLPAYAMTGPLLISAVFHLTGQISTHAPVAVSICIQVALGSALGARFYGLSLAKVGGIIMLAIGMVITMLLVTVLSAWVLSILTGFSFESLILALAPGGFAEMTLAALSMRIDPAFVTTHHGLRLLIVVFAVPISIKLWQSMKR